MYFQTPFSLKLDFLFLATIGSLPYREKYFYTRLRRAFPTSCFRTCDFRGTILCREFHLLKKNLAILVNEGQVIQCIDLITSFLYVIHYICMPFHRWSPLSVFSLNNFAFSSASSTTIPRIYVENIRKNPLKNKIVQYW